MNTVFKPMVRIENWRKTDTNQLIGEVYGHPRFEDGHLVQTSLIVEETGNIVETRNSRYYLGVPAASS